MSGSNLPVWAIILILGEIAIIIMSFINPYVPKEQKKKAKEKRRSIVYYKTHFNELLILLIGVAISVAAVIAFVIEDYSDLVANVGGGILGHLIAVLLMIFGFFLTEIAIILTIVIIEDLVIMDTKDYYEKRYSAILLDISDIAFDKTNEDPRE